MGPSHGDRGGGEAVIASHHSAMPSIAPIPSHWLVVALNEHTAKIRKKMKRVPGSRLR